ncbi:MAG: hypothetical protein NC231_11020 [Bacillus sp. (in: Bacteria)]|nr:hypothetical protein [Bacillus sp. (in: firmicutes)]MCM1427318.1 hypothetical protein [Eubacterium sp.]
MKRKFLALFLTATLAVSVTACGSDDSASVSAPADVTASAEGGAETEQKEEAVKEAEEEKKEEAEETKQEVEDPIGESLKRMADVTSMKMEMVMNMDMTAEMDGETESMESVTVADMECITDPLKIKMEMTVDMGEDGSQTMSIYGDLDESGNYMMYMYDGMDWMAMPVAEIDMEAYNAQSSMEAQIGDTSAYVLEGMEKLNGADAYKYSCTMSGDEMKEAIASAGAMDSLAAYGIAADDAYAMMDGVGEMVTYVWVDAETLYPVKYEMDMTEIMDAVMSGVVEALGEQAQGITMHVTRMDMIMTCSDFNAVSDITVPAEALAAVELAE